MPKTKMIYDVLRFDGIQPRTAVFFGDVGEVEWLDLIPRFEDLSDDCPDPLLLDYQASLDAERERFK